MGSPSGVMTPTKGKLVKKLVLTIYPNGPFKIPEDGEWINVVTGVNFENQTVETKQIWAPTSMNGDIDQICRGWNSATTLTPEISIFSSADYSSSTPDISSN